MSHLPDARRCDASVHGLVAVAHVWMQLDAALQAGLPQGSPLFPILLLFFNADLVQ
jgi:hypothetical protein